MLHNADAGPPLPSIGPAADVERRTAPVPQAADGTQPSAVFCWSRGKGSRIMPDHASPRLVAVAIILRDLADKITKTPTRTPEAREALVDAADALKIAASDICEAIESDEVAQDRSVVG